MTRETANRLLRLADAGHIPCQVFVCEGEKETPQRPAEFAHLEQHFLRYGAGSRYMSECQPSPCVGIANTTGRGCRHGA